MLLFCVDTRFYWKKDSTPSVPFYKSILQKSRVLRKVVGIINLLQMHVTITKLPFIYREI